MERSSAGISAFGFQTESAEAQMGRRYAFWKTSAGKPHRKDHGATAPVHILAQIGESSRVKADAGISWEGVGFDIIRLQIVINSALMILGPDDEELNETDSGQIIREAINSLVRETGGSKALLPLEVIRHADSHAAEFFRKATSDYILVTSISLKSLPWKRLKIQNCEIAPLSKRGDKFPLPSVSRYANEFLRKHLDSTKYQLIKVKTSGRSIHEASERAFNCVHLLRGIWGYFGTHGAWTVMSDSTNQKPLGVIHRGPVSTLHFPDGRLVDELYWYDQDFSGDEELFEPKNGWGYLEKQRRHVMHRLKQCDYRKDLENILMRYAIALDNRSLHICFLQLWSLLEKVTDTIGSTYDETIRRTAWGWNDRKVAMEMLEFLRLRRNQYVHSGSVGKNHDQATFLLKHLLEPHLLRLMKNWFHVSSLEEYGRHLALSSEVATLKKQRDRMNHAIRTLRKWHGP